MAWKGGPEDVRARADTAFLRAGRAGLAAENVERRARSAPSSLRELLETLARLHRRIEMRHRTAAALQLAHADRLDLWEEGPDRSISGRPALLACVGDVVGAESAVTLQGSTGDPAVIATSGELAHAAMQLELAAGEGPMHDCLSRGRAIPAVSPAETWRTYGSGAAGLGVATVAANPLDGGGRRLGVLITFNTHPSAPDADPVRDLPVVAAAVTDSLLGLDRALTPGLPEWDVVGAPGQDVAALLHCASGIVSENLGCPPEEALDIITARAVATGEQVESVARGIIGRPISSRPSRAGTPRTSPRG